MPTKFARRSFEKPYECLKDWPEECFVQAGDDGLVIDREAEEGSYMTAFFEAFPTCNGISTFLRGEGATVEDAEARAFELYLKRNACPHDGDWEKRGYTNGLGFCCQCGVSESKHFPPAFNCCICDVATDYTHDIDGKYYCKEHKNLKPEDKKTETDRYLDRCHAELEELNARRQKAA